MPAACKSSVLTRVLAGRRTLREIEDTVLVSGDAYHDLTTAGLVALLAMRPSTSDPLLHAVLQRRRTHASGAWLRNRMAALRDVGAGEDKERALRANLGRRERW